MWLLTKCYCADRKKVKPKRLPHIVKQWIQTHFCSCCNLCWSSSVAEGSEISEARLGVESLWDWCLCELLISRLETLRPASANHTREPSDPLFPWGVSGARVQDGFCDGWMTVGSLVLVAVWGWVVMQELFWLLCLTRTEDGWLDVTSFSKQRTWLHKNILMRIKHTDTSAECTHTYTHKNETISFDSTQIHQPWEPFWVWGCCWGQSSAGGTADSASCLPPSGEKRLPTAHYPESTCAYNPSPETHKQHLCMTVAFLQIQSPTVTHCLQSFEEFSKWKVYHSNQLYIIALQQYIWHWW